MSDYTRRWSVALGCASALLSAPVFAAPGAVVQPAPAMVAPTAAPVATPVPLNPAPAAKTLPANLDEILAAPSGTDLPPPPRTRDISVTRKEKAVKAADNFTDPDAFAIQVDGKDAKPAPKVSVAAQPMLEKAYLALVSGHLEAAIRLYRDAFALVPNDRSALFGLATAYHKAGQRAQAKEVYERLLALYPNDVEGLNNYLVLKGDDDPKTALADLAERWQKHPEEGTYPAQMAMIYKRQGELSKAAFYLSEALKLDPKNTTYAYNLAVIYDSMQDVVRARALYSQVVDSALRGEPIPGSVNEIQQRLIYLGSK